MIAEATPDAQLLLGTLVVLSFLASVASNVMGVLRISATQKRQVTFATEFVTKAEMEALDSRMGKVEETIDALRGKSEDDKNEILQAGEHRAEALHKRINEVLTAVSHVQGEMHALRRRS